MSPRFARIRALVALSLVGIVSLAAAPKTKTDLAQTNRASMDAFWNQEYKSAEEMARSVVGAPGATKADLVEAQKTLACVYVMQKQQLAAIQSLMSMLKIDPTARFSLEESYPPPVISRYWSVRDSLFSGTTDIKTIAVGDFENNSVYTGKFKDYDFGALAKALPHLITCDLAEAGDLKVVDRQRTSELMKELAISASGVADKKQGVKIGKFLGAHAYIFGQYMVLSKDKVRIDARVVQTATGEVLQARQVTAEFSGDPEKFFALEKQLITELLTTLKASGVRTADDPVGQASAYFEKRSKNVGNRKGYVEGLFLTAEALRAEEARDYKTAVDGWKKVLAADPGNELAALRVKVLEPLAKQG
jgi:TolB-like protein